MYNRDATTYETTARAVGELVLRERAELANTHFSMRHTRKPLLKGQVGDSARIASLQDSQFHLSFLAAALFADNPKLFVDVVGWAKIALAKRGWATADLASNLVCLCDALRFELPREAADVAIGFVRDAIELLPSLPDETPPYIGPGDPFALVAGMYHKALVRGDLGAARQFILGVVEEGIGVRDIYLHVLQRTLYEIGRLWQLNQISVAREHLCTAAIQSVMALMHQHFAFDQEKSGRTVVTTCVAGEQHEIGIRMVSDFFEMAGWDSYYLGANTPTESVIRELIDRQADVLAVSITMIYHIPVLADLIAAVRRTPECAHTRILVGGYPFRLQRDLWSTVDADGEAPDAALAVAKAQSWFDAEGRLH